MAFMNIASESCYQNHYSSDVKGDLNLEHRK